MRTLTRRFAAVSLVVGLCAAWPRTARADESAEQTARVHFVAGINLLRDPGKPRYEEAYAEFKRAYELFPSFKMLGNIGFTAMKLERDAEAIDAYTRYLAEATDLDADERGQVERDVATLKAGLVSVVVESRPEGAILLDTRIVSQGDPITNAYGALRGRTPLAVRRGHHVFKARFADGTESRWELDLAGGESHVFEGAGPAPRSASPVTDVPSGPAPARPIPKSVYASGIATVALGASALITGIRAVDSNSRFKSANDGSDPSKAEDLRSSGQALNVATDVLAVGAVLAAGITAYLYISRPAVTTTSAHTVVGPRGIAIVF
jgi:hypothetical protein